MAIYYTVIGLFVVGVIWVLLNARSALERDALGRIVKPQPQTRRDELIQARAKLERQIEILKTPSRARLYKNLSRQNIARLQTLLDQIKAEIGEAG